MNGERREGGGRAGTERAAERKIINQLSDNQVNKETNKGFLQQEVNVSDTNGV